MLINLIYPVHALIRCAGRGSHDQNRPTWWSTVAEYTVLSQHARNITAYNYLSMPDIGAHD